MSPATPDTIAYQMIQLLYQGLETGVVFIISGEFRHSYYTKWFSTVIHLPEPFRDGYPVEAGTSHASVSSAEFICIMTREYEIRVRRHGDIPTIIRVGKVFKSALGTFYVVHVKNAFGTISSEFLSLREALEWTDNWVSGCTKVH